MSDGTTAVVTVDPKAQDGDGEQRHLQVVDDDPGDTPPVPVMHGQWRLVLILDHGRVEHYIEGDCTTVEEKAARLHNAVWRIDRRLVTPWQPVGRTKRTRTVIEELDDDPGADDDDT